MESPVVVAQLLDSADPRLSAVAIDDESNSPVVIRRTGEDNSSATTSEIVDACASAGSTGVAEHATPKLVDALMNGIDAALICCGATGADQRAGLFGSSLSTSPNKGGRPTTISGGLLERTVQQLFERLRETENELPGLRRTHEVRVSAMLLQKELPIDLLGPPPAAAVATSPSKALQGAPCAGGGGSDGNTEPSTDGAAAALRLKRSSGRHGVHVSGLRSIVASSASEANAKTGK